MRPQLRLYSENESALTDEQQRANVHMRLGDLLPVVAMAQRMNFIWLQDFLEDEICVTPDLYEVIQAFQAMRPSA